MNFLERIDALILSFFTKISHKFQIWTSRTNFFLAKLTISLLELSVILSLLNIFIPLLDPKTNPVTGVTVGGIWIYWISKDWEKLKDAENRSLHEEQAKTSFFIPGQNCFERLAWLIMFFLLNFKQLINGVLHPKVHWIIELIVWSFLLQVAVYTYFTSITPLPPGRNKVRQWLESFFLKPAPIRVRN